MSQAIDVLMNEHRCIEKVLAALESCASELRRGRSLERGRAKEFADFFRGYADALHHGKEEDLLFRRMVEYGFPSGSGPIAVMLEEHTIGRGHVARLRAIGEAGGTIGPDELDAFVSTAGAFVPMLREHIRKEDLVLYPLAMRVLPPEELDRLAEEYEEFQRKAAAEGDPAALLRSAERLVAAHPFDPAVLEPGPRPQGLCHAG